MASTSTNAHMTYAQALTDARTLIVQQSARIKADAQKIKAQADEIAQWRAMADEMGAELQRQRARVAALEPRLADTEAALELAESTICRQQMEIEVLDTASREHQRTMADQAARINELTAELDQIRDALPTDADEAALVAMTTLLSVARRPRAKRAEPSVAAVQIVQERDTPDRRIERAVISANSTPFCQVAQRKAA
jgi:chromosome segregation ATPase